MNSTETGYPRLLLFDYGGVLLHLNDPVETFGIGGSREAFNELWLMSPAVQAHERGEIGPADFARQMVHDLQLPYSPQEFIARFDAWPDRIPETTAALLQAVPAHIDCAILSNTNALHWQRQDIAGDLRGRINRCFLSFETGLIKPDRRAFQHVLDETGHRPADVLFLDDNPRNIDAAALLGMRTRLCPGVASLERILRDAAIIPD